MKAAGTAIAVVDERDEVRGTWGVGGVASTVFVVVSGEADAEVDEVT